MLLRAIGIVGGLAGAGTMAQFPEYSQQYVQRLGGAVDALAEVVADFDRSAEAEGKTRQAALDAMTGNSDSFVIRRGEDMTRTIARSERLSADLIAVRDASAFLRLTQAPRFMDPEIAREALQDFEPAVPLTLEGVGFATSGFFIGWGVLVGLWAALRWPFRRKGALGPAPGP
ncbi:DUF2937 family protein [Alphaproteobacteria bacterium KMM 3653]|uniref:DUF2937 family protein n=1 Tax=Harenicola maris TaxID=2841044 RepID=A0AAP2CQD3_9RHOB|nr:DUF2937 family protein [Harenicola maris]